MQKEANGQDEPERIGIRAGGLGPLQAWKEFVIPEDWNPFDGQPAEGFVWKEIVWKKGEKRRASEQREKTKRFKGGNKASSVLRESGQHKRRSRRSLGRPTSLREESERVPGVAQQRPLPRLTERPE